MITSMDKLMESGCSSEKKDRVCRSRGGESCAFDGAMIVLQPIADAAHLVHGPIACCGNSWEGRGTLSHVGARHAMPLYKMGFTTDMNEMDIIYGSEKKLYEAVLKTCEAVKPRAVFVYATCVSGLIGEDIEDVCRKAEKKSGVRIIPVNAPGFVGPKNLGNRIAGEVLLDHVIGTGEPPLSSPLDKGGMWGVINLIGEYNIAGDLWLVEPVLKEAGVRILSRITGDATFEEITYAHRAKLNVVVCSRALINIAKGMKKRYGIPYVEVSFFGKTEMSKALRAIKKGLTGPTCLNAPALRVDATIKREEKRLEEKLKPYEHLRGKKAVLYTGGVKSWSFISALMDLGIEIKAVGTKKSSIEDEEKMRLILGEDAPLIEDTTPRNLLRMLKENKADMLIAGGRNQYLAVKEGYPFVDVNQERHSAYAGYDGLINLAEQISNGIKFYGRVQGFEGSRGRANIRQAHHHNITLNPRPLGHSNPAVVINPLNHSASIGAAMALQGVDNALPVLHGAQGCSFLGKVLLTKHFREPIALMSTKLFTEDVVMGNEENIIRVVTYVLEKQKPNVVGVLSSGLSSVKGDNVQAAVDTLSAKAADRAIIFQIQTPDYEGGLETGYAKAVEGLVSFALEGERTYGQINVLAGPHLTPADFTELREIVESFGLRPILLPDLSALDGSRQGLSALSKGGTTLDEIKGLGSSEFTIAIGMSMEPAALKLKERFGIEYRTVRGLSGIVDSDIFVEILSMLSGRPVPRKLERQRNILVDGLRDAHFYFGGKKACIALDPDLCLQTSRWLSETGADVALAVVPHYSPAADDMPAKEIAIGDLHSISGEFNILISNSHAEDTALRLGLPLYQAGFPVYKVIGHTAKVTIGYRGTHAAINEVANHLMKGGHS